MARPGRHFQLAAPPRFGRALPRPARAAQRSGDAQAQGKGARGREPGQGQGQGQRERQGKGKESSRPRRARARAKATCAALSRVCSSISERIISIELRFSSRAPRSPSVSNHSTRRLPSVSTSLPSPPLRRWPPRSPRAGPSRLSGLGGCSVSTSSLRCANLVNASSTEPAAGFANHAGWVLCCGTGPQRGQARSSARAGYAAVAADRGMSGHLPRGWPPAGHLEDHCSRSTSIGRCSPSRRRPAPMTETRNGRTCAPSGCTAQSGCGRSRCDQCRCSRCRLCWTPRASGMTWRCCRASRQHCWRPSGPRTA